MMCHLTIAMYIVCILSLSYINGFIIYDKSISAAAFTTTVHHLDRRRYHKHNKLNQTFGVATTQRQRLIFMSSSSNDDGKTNNQIDDKDDNEELSMAIAKVRLEQSMKPAYLTKKPIKLSYKTSQRWIQKNWSPKSKKEFDDLVANGNLRTPYISKCPEEYYGERGEWISWDHYLLSNPDDDDISDSNNGKNGTNVMLKWQ